MAEEINKTYTSNSLYNDSTGVIAFAEQLKQELINWANYQHVTEELGQNRPDLQNELNNLFLSVYERFLTFLNDADASEEAINTWKEIENFLADYTDEKTLASIVAELNNKIESRLTVPLESTTGSSTTSTMTQKAITETIDASKTFTTGEKVDNVGIDSEPTAESDNLVKSGGVVTDLRNKLVDFSLLSGYTISESNCVNNFKYFICKDSSILQYSPKINIIYNNEQIPYRICVTLNNNRSFYFEGIGKKENDYFALEYDWSNHTNNVSLSIQNSHILVNSASYAQGLAFLLSKIKTINSDVNTINDTINSLDGNVTNLQSTLKLTNSALVNKCFYDTNVNGYISNSILVRQALVKEIYIIGEPFEDDNPLELVSYTTTSSNHSINFNRRTDSDWAFRIQKEESFKGRTIEKVTYDSKTIYFVIDWNNPLISGNISGIHSSVILSEGCYNLENNPIIANYIKEQEQEILNNEFATNEKVTYYTEYEQSVLDPLYIPGIYVYSSGKINNAGQKPYGSYCIPITSGEIVKIEFDETYDSNTFVSAAFSTNLTSGTQAQIIVEPLSGGTSKSEVFTATTNGYIIIWMYTPATDKFKIKIYQGTKSLIKEVLDDGIDEKWLSKEVQEKLNNNVNQKYPSFSKAIVCSGSSITWGTGALDSSMVKYVDKFLKENLSSTVLPNEMIYSDNYSNVNNLLLYNGLGRKISTIDETIEFDLFGDEIAICQMKRRTETDYGVINVYADNELIGQFDNKNHIKHESENFTDNSFVTIKLKHPCTFNHIIKINGSSTPLTKIVYNTGGYGSHAPSDPTTFDAFVFRALDSNGLPIHGIEFSSALGTITSISVEYDYGNIVTHEKSTVGQTDDEYTNESYYGNGTTSYDPDAPTGGIDSGMEFRAINHDAFFVHKFTTAKTRHYKIKLVGGVNPYFIINYVTNRYHDLMNAGIGGWSIAHLINNDKINDYTQFFKWFNPDLIFQESETNDDWSYSTRRIRRNIGEITLSQLRELPWLEVHTVTYNNQTDKYAVEMCTGLIDSITYTSLISSHIIGTNTQVGDIIRIGNYHGDIKETICRKITEVNLTTGQVKWIEPLSLSEILNIDSLDDLIGAEINIRDLSGYKTAYKNFIQKVHEIYPETPIVVVNNGLPMLGARQLWGYDVIHKEIVGESSNVKYLDAREILYKGQFETITGIRNETITSTGSSSYDLLFNGANKSWYGFKVLVNGIDVYGNGCYIQSQYMYRAKSSLNGESLNKSNPYTRSNADYSTSDSSIKMKLVFTKNIPSINDTIEVWFSDQIWSNDYCHPSEFGGFLYGQAYSKFLK